MPLIEHVTRDGKRGLQYNLHDGQLRAWNSEKRVVAVISGVRGGKSSFAPLWLHREMVRRGPGDYLAVAPSFPLLNAALRPEIESLFGSTFKLGVSTQRQFTVAEAGHEVLWPGVPYVRPSRIVYGHAQNPESLAGLTAKAAVLDEAGQKDFRLGSYEEVQRRVSFDVGRILITTTVYNLGWLKQQVYDRWEQAKGAHPEIDVVNFRSIDNPGFPPEEYYRAMRELPTWKFRMFFDGAFTRPAGLIYDNFDPARHVCPRHALPDDWPRYAGLDFGAVNTAAVYLAEERDRDTRAPTGRFVAYREYPDREFVPGKYAAEAHAVRMLKGEPTTPLFVGGSGSEDDWRARFRAAGLPVAEPPVGAVEVQIDAVYRLIAEGRLVVMDDCVGLLDQLASYSRELDEQGEPTEKIDNDAAFHYLAALRYVVSHLSRGGLAGFKATRDDRSRTAVAPAGVFMEAGGEPEGHGDRKSYKIGRDGGGDNHGCPAVW